MVFYPSLMSTNVLLGPAGFDTTLLNNHTVGFLNASQDNLGGLAPGNFLTNNNFLVDQSGMAQRGLTT